MTRVDKSSSRMRPALALIPFGYFLSSRLKSVRDVAFLIATSWLPAIWLIMRLDGKNLVEAISGFLLGYLAFIAVYEVGYLTNDLWDARRSHNGRARFDHVVGPAYLAGFVAVRLACWVAVASLTGWVSNPVWLAGFGALLIALAQHNLTPSPALRLASFLELAVLRFLLPILALVPRGQLWVVTLVALLLYAYPRFLSYMDSKSLLRLNEGRGRTFGLAQLLSLAPLLLFIAYVTATPVIAELLAYFILAYAIGSIGFGRRNG